MLKRIFQLLLLLAVSGCAAHRVSRDIRQTMTEASGSKLNTLISEIGRTSSRQMVSKTLWLVDASYGDREDHFRLSLVLSPAGDLRFDLLPRTGSTSLGLGAVTSTRAIFLDPRDRKAYVGSSDSPLLRRALGIELNSNEFAGLVLGHVNLPSTNLTDYRLWCSADEELCVLEWANFQRLWWFKRGDLRPSRIEHRRAQTERLILNAEYDWSEEVPRKTRIVTTDPAVDFQLENTLNQNSKEVAQKLFEINPPQSYTISSLP